MTFQELTHPHDLDVDLTLMRQCLAGTRDGYSIPKRYLRADGAVVDAYLSVSLIRTPAGEPEHFVSQIVDLTDLNHAQQDPAYGWVELEVVTSVGSGRAREDARRDLGTRVRWQVPVD